MNLAVVGHQCCRVEVDVDVAVGGEHVFGQPVQTASANAIQVRTDLFSAAGHLMAHRTVRREQRRSTVLIAGRF